jgi:RES domain-containing protein
MPQGWRLVKARLAAHAFDGEGARRYGGRWNSPGTKMVYTSQSAALAALELLVHLNNSAVLASYVLFSAQFDDRLVTTLDRSRLPRNWRTFPAPSALQALGDSWVKSRASLVLAVPSAVVDGETNYLINPEHADIAALAISPPKRFEFDQRLLKSK